MSVPNMSNTGDRYAFPNGQLNCETSVVHFSFGLDAEKSLFITLSATAPTVPM